jgi:peptide deformylase
MICASCSNEIDRGNMVESAYYNSYGNYCRKCCERISKTCLKHYQENLDKFNYAFQANKNKKNMKAWIRKGYIGS